MEVVVLDCHIERVQLQVGVFVRVGATTAAPGEAVVEARVGAPQDQPTHDGGMAAVSRSLERCQTLETYLKLTFIIKLYTPGENQYYVY